MTPSFFFFAEEEEEEEEEGMKALFPGAVVSRSERESVGGWQRVIGWSFGGKRPPIWMTL